VKKLQYRVISITVTIGIGIGLYLMLREKPETSEKPQEQGTNSTTSDKSPNLQIPTKTSEAHSNKINQGGSEATTASKNSEKSRDAIPPGTRQKTLGSKRTACSDAYEAVIELNNNPTLVDTFTMDDESSKKCTAELQKLVPNFDKYASELEKCNSNKGKLDADGKNECLRVASILRLSLVENEFRGKDPADLPSPVIRSMLAYRALQMNNFTDNEPDIDYFFRLANEEQRLSPDNDLGSLRSLLAGYLVKKNPGKYENDFEQTILDIEQKNPESALSSRIQRYDTSDPDLAAEIDLFLNRNPNSAYGLYAKAAVLAQKGDWAGADSLMSRAISFAKDKEFYEKERAKFAKKEVGLVLRQNFQINL
jgi:hypothetical protein